MAVLGLAVLAGAAVATAQDLERVEALLQAGRADEAWQSLASAPGESSPQRRLLASRILEALDRLPAAAAEAEAAVELDPSGEAARLQWGRLFLAGNNPEEALRIFSAGLETNPDSILLHVGRGLALNRLMEYEQAAAEFERCLAWQPSLGIAFDGLTEALMQLQRFGEALQRAKAYLEQNPDDYRGYYYVVLAEDREGLGAAEQHEAMLREAIERNSRHAPSYALLGKTLLRLDRPEEAALMLESCIRLRPDERHGRIQLARAYRALGRDEDAREQARILQELQRQERASRSVLRRGHEDGEPSVRP